MYISTRKQGKADEAEFLAKPVIKFPITLFFDHDLLMRKKFPHARNHRHWTISGVSCQAKGGLINLHIWVPFTKTSGDPYTENICITPLRRLYSKGAARFSLINVHFINILKRISERPAELGGTAPLVKLYGQKHIGIQELHPKCRVWV